MAREPDNKILAKLAPIKRLLRLSIEELETVYPCLRRGFDLFVVRVQLSLPRPLSERVGKVELLQSWHHSRTGGVKGVPAEPESRGHS